MERTVDATLNAPRCCSRRVPRRGALDGFIAEVIDDHIREHMVDAKVGRDSPQSLAAEELIEIVHQHLKNEFGQGWVATFNPRLP